MYNCQVCGTKSRPRESRLLYVIYRSVPRDQGGTRQEIAKEVPVCRGCHTELAAGVTLRELRDRYDDPALEAVVPAPQPPVPKPTVPPVPFGLVGRGAAGVLRGGASRV